MAKEELSHKVYLTTFDKPRYVMEIGNIIYRVERQTYPKLMGENGAINRCLEKGWIEDVTDSMKIPKEKPLGFEKRRYYKAKIDPIISKIKDKVSLNDRYVLRNILNSKAFGYLINKRISEDPESLSVDAIEFILGYLDVLFIISEHSKLLKKRFRQIKTEEQYDNEIKTIKKDKKLMEQLIRITSKLFQQEELPSEITEDFVYLYAIPGELSLTYTGYGQFGEFYYTMKTLSQTILDLTK